MEEEIKKGMGLVRFVISKYYPNKLHDDDYLQEGMIGLWKALKKFDPSRNIKFSTYAVACIHGGIRNFITREKRKKPTYSLEFQLGENLTLKDTLFSESDIFEDKLVNEIDTKRDMHQLEPKLNDVGRKILYLKYDGKTQSEIAVQLGVSRSKVFNEMKRIRETFKEYGGVAVG